MMNSTKKRRVSVYAWRDSYNLANMVMQNGYKKIMSQFMMKCPTYMYVYMYVWERKDDKMNKQKTCKLNTRNLSFQPYHSMW